MLAEALRGSYIGLPKVVNPLLGGFAGDKVMSQPKSKLSRRQLFAGAGTVGAMAAAASLLPGAVQESAPEPQAKQPPARGGGYQLTEHVKKYYKTTLV
jgi:hypothetical protein